ncbi:MAG: cation-translocating P-type ATPase [Burkholderiales bacterium]
MDPNGGPSSTKSALQHLSGLTRREAAHRLAVDGPNELPAGRAPRLFAIAAGVFAEPMFLLLIGAIAIYLALGDVREALILAASMVAVVAIAIHQQHRTERTLHALRDLSSPRALVLREGVEQRIPGREVVRGDLVLLREGDRIPADGLLREAVEVSTDESLLTGESLPIDKHADSEAQTMARPGGASGPSVYSGTLVVHGHGNAEILATGPRTEIGRIGHALLSIEPETTPLQRETRRVVRRLAVAGLALCVVVSIAYGVLRGHWADAILAGVTLAMGILPEEFPVVLTVFLALGAWRISRHKVLTRRMPAIETLGATTVLCVDKTGTLTENRMQVAVLETPDTRIDLRHDGAATLDATARKLLATAAAASELEAFDPMERAIQRASDTLARDEMATIAAMTIVREYELSPEILAVTHVWKAGGDGPLLVAVKGAPEVVARLCRLNDERRSQLLDRVSALAHDGLRVLAIAGGHFQGESFPASPHGFTLEFRGLVALADPARPSVPKALSECYRAGIRVLMITGDHPGTALAIGRAIGLDMARGVLTGAEIAEMGEDALRREVAHVNVFARVIPEQKLRLVQALKANGEVVAMTGDGVNDAPALKAAHIGVAMGSRGTDVAREAAALVLLDDDFASLVATVRQGRRIYDNIRNAMTYLLAVHIPLGGMGLIPVLFGWPLFLFPVHVVFLEFVIDPACSLVFEAERSEKDVMDRPPRDPREPLFTREMLAQSMFLGLGAFAAVAIVYAVALGSAGEPQARAMGFITLVVTNLLLILANRSHRESFMTVLARPNRMFWLISLLAFTALVMAVYLPGAAAVFRFESPSPVEAVASVLAAILAVAWIEAVKLARRRRRPAR